VKSKTKFGRKKTMLALARMKPLAAIAVTAGLLTACAAASFEVRTRCPSLAEYTAARQKQALDELTGLPPDSALGEFMDDYGELRKRCRAVEKKI
jgi:hypothetical protein